MKHAETDASRGRIVVIEDTVAIRVEVADILRLEGFEVHEAGDGRTGLALITDVEPDVVLCDVMMPTMDGHATLAALRDDPRWATLPFVFLTARTERDAVRRGMQLGADDYLTKPFTADELLAAVATALEKRQRLEVESESRVNRLRTELSSTLPHELRTPLNVVVGYAEMLAEGARELPPETIEALARNVLTGTRRLSRVTENVLLTAQLDVLESESKTARPALSLRCAGLVSDAAAASVADHQRQTDLALDVDPQATAAIDHTSLRKIVEELVDNAAKFSPAGSPIAVHAARVGAAFELHVRDAGCGMSREQIEHVGAFMQFDRGRFEQQGLGLGLSLAVRLARLHGGALTIAPNADGPGVTVTVRLFGAPGGESLHEGEQVVDGDRLA